ncbi:unnamed protein product [Caenorhabditis angaria]|uniref:Uncharacterized protein n=1 Tax=Caenorhabditis angaria TaxID=860376 RepID=A0A9P1I8R0_9PELO|nr:unnamed protein product [Caenorhabditis angaria]
MGNTKDASNLTTLSPVRRKRKAAGELDLSTAAAHRGTLGANNNSAKKSTSRDEEKENLLLEKRRKSNSKSTSPAANSPRKKSQRRVSHAQQQQKAVSRRKNAAPRKLEDLKRDAESGKDRLNADQLLTEFLSFQNNASQLTTNTFLCRNIRKNLEKKSGEKPKFNAKIGYDLLKKMRSQMMKQNGDRPIFTMEFDKILNWPDTLELEYCNDITATSTVKFSVLLVDEQKNVKMFPAGFAIVPLFKHIEENFSEEDRMKSSTLKLRQFSCPQKLVNESHEIYLLVEASRMMNKECEKILGEGKRIRSTATKSKDLKPKNLSMDLKDYVEIKTFGCTLIYKSDAKNQLNCTIEGISRVSLHEFRDQKLEVENLRALNSTNKNPPPNQPGLIISTFGQAKYKEIRNPNQIPMPRSSRPPRRSATTTTTKIPTNWQLNCERHPLLERNICPISLRRFADAESFAEYLRFRFPCFTFDLRRGKISRNLEYFTKTAKTTKFEGFVFKKGAAQRPKIAAASAAAAAKESDDSEDEEEVVHLATMSACREEVFPSCPFRYATRKDAEFALPLPKRKSRKPAAPAPQPLPKMSADGPSLRKRAHVSPEKKPTPRGTQAEAEEEEEEPQKDNRLKVLCEKFLGASLSRKEAEAEAEQRVFETSMPRENSAVLNGIFLREEFLSNFESHDPENSEFKVENFQLDKEQVILYRQKQIEAIEEVRKEESRKRRKKGAKRAGVVRKPQPTGNEPKADKNLNQLAVPAENGGIDLDIEGFAIPVEGCLHFDPIVQIKYDFLLRCFYADAGHRTNPASATRKSSMMTQFISTYHTKIFSQNLAEIYLKHLQLMFIDEKNPIHYLTPLNRFLEQMKAWDERPGPSNRSP